MNVILVFIDGAICDDRHRLHLYETSLNQEGAAFHMKVRGNDEECYKT